VRCLVQVRAGGDKPRPYVRTRTPKSAQHGWSGCAPLRMWGRGLSPPARITDPD